MVDVKRFKIYVTNTKVWKGWDYVVLPDGRKVEVPPGKYVKVFSEVPLVFGFEDLTEEIGQRPDWDFNEPRLEVVEESGIITKKVKMRATYEAAYEVHLYFDDALVHEFKPGAYSVDIEFSYTEVEWPIIAGALVPIAFGLAVVVASELAKRR